MTIIIFFLFIYSLFFSRDPATRVFGLFLLGTLAMITLGAIAGIAAGNIAHYSKHFLITIDQSILYLS
jgi:hypothetical protein